MAEVLILTLDGSGNVPPALAVGAELRARGHAVRVLGTERQAPDVAAAGLEHVPYRHPRPWVAEEPRSMTRSLLDFLAMVGSRAYGRDLADAHALRPVDVVLVDAMIPAGARAGLRLGLPTAVLMHTFSSFFGSPIFELAGRVRGFSTRRAWADADVVLVATDADLDPGSQRPRPTFVWTGVAEAAPKALPRASSNGNLPKVLVSLSSVHIPGQDGILQRILDGLADLPLHVVVTTGPTIDPTGLRVPPNATVHRHVPHRDVMPECALVVGHGGHSTTMRALMHGLPLLVLPADPRVDQPSVGRAVQGAGAGLSLDRSAAPDRIRAAVRTILGDPAFRAAADVVGQRMRAQDGVRTAADRLEGLALR